MTDPRWEAVKPDAHCDDVASLRARSAIAHVCAHLHLSNYFAAKDRAKLTAAGITHILVCAQELPLAFSGDASLTYESLGLTDNPSSQLPLAAAMSFIDAARDAGGRVLCHCAAGGSRSASVVIAWVMREQQLTYDEALAFVREQRHVQPNAGFEEQLRAWEQRLARDAVPGPSRAWVEGAAAALRAPARQLACAAPLTEAAALQKALVAVWAAWAGVSDGAPPLHSKAVGFATATGDYVAVYRMCAASLRGGRYKYGDAPLACATLGTGDDCEWRAWSPPPPVEMAAPFHVWHGAYTVVQRPWYQHAAMHGCGWVVYADPVTHERVRSYVEPLRAEDGTLAGVMIVGTFASAGGPV